MKRVSLNMYLVAIVVFPFAFIATASLSSCAPQPTGSAPDTVRITAPYSDTLTAVCVRGVQYWENERGNFTPKYSPGYHNPDTCSQ